MTTTEPTNALAQQQRSGGLSLATIREMTGFDLAQIALIRHNMAISMGVQPDEVPLRDVALFLHANQALNLDPLLRQSHWIVRGGKGVLQVGIDGYRAIAERTGVYAGSEPARFGGQIEQEYEQKEWVTEGGRRVEKWVSKTLIVPEKATVVVWKIVAGHKAAFTGEAYWTEFYPGQREGFQWRKMPRHMLAKVAEAQALRKAFPAQLGSVALESTIDVSEVQPLPEVGVHDRVIEQPQLDTPRPRPAVTYEQVWGDDQAGTAYADLPAEQGSQEPPAEPSKPSRSDLWAKNRELVAEASKRGLQGVPTLPQRSAEDAIAAANADLADRIRAYDAGHASGSEATEQTEF